MKEAKGVEERTESADDGEGARRMGMTESEEDGGMEEDGRMVEDGSKLANHSQFFPAPVPRSNALG